MPNAGLIRPGNELYRDSLNLEPVLDEEAREKDAVGEDYLNDICLT